MVNKGSKYINLLSKNIKNRKHSLRNLKKFLLGLVCSNSSIANHQLDQLIKNYGIGAQIIKSLHIKDMILVTRSRKKVVGLEGYGIRITKQEIIR